MFFHELSFDVDKLLVIVDGVAGVISVEAGKLKCLVCHSSICSHCNYISSFNRLDPAGYRLDIAEMFDSNRLAKVNSIYCCVI